MLYDYIVDNYDNGEPIFLSELPGKSTNYIRQEMKKFVDEGKLERLYSGVYFLPYTTILGTKGKVSSDKLIEKKYISYQGRILGYITGIQFANKYGFTTQMPACLEVCSNAATTQQRKLEIAGQKLIVYKPVTEINNENRNTLQFLDFMSNINKYSELAGDEVQHKLRELANQLNINFLEVKKYISLFPDRIYKNLYEGGLMNELV